MLRSRPLSRRECEDIGLRLPIAARACSRCHTCYPIQSGSKRSAPPMTRVTAIRTTTKAGGGRTGPRVRGAGRILIGDPSKGILRSSQHRQRHEQNTSSPSSSPIVIPSLLHGVVLGRGGRRRSGRRGVRRRVRVGAVGGVALELPVPPADAARVLGLKPLRNAL